MHRNRLLLTCAAVVSFPAVAAAQTFEIDEPVTDARVFSVRQTMTLAGKLKAPLPGGKSIPLDMKGTVTQSFRERRLEGRGRDAKAYRMLRSYASARLQVAVGGEKTEKTLSAASRLMVVHGGAAGLSVYSPSGPLTYDDVELLRMPGDSLSLLPFLPPGKMRVGGSWTPSGFAVQMLTGIDAVAKSTVTCKLKSAAGGMAVIALAGKVEGARDGAPTSIDLDGEITYHLARNYVSGLKLTQKESSRTGPISPALDITARIELHREPAADAGPLSPKSAAGVELEPKDSLLKIRFQPADGVTFLVDRGWHVTHHRDKLSILRLLKEGNLLVQATLRRLPDAAPGKHVAEEQFQKDIAAALGSRVKSIVRAEQIKPKGRTDDRRFLYRVLVDGSDNGIAMRWHYYLCAAPDGRQLSLVFAVEKKLLSQLDDQDLGFVLGLEFQKRNR
jgi:hypothetical protein